MTNQNSESHRSESVVDWIVSGLTALVAIGGLVSLGTALILFFPGTNRVDASSPEPQVVETTVATTLPLVATTVPDATGESSTTSEATPVTSTTLEVSTTTSTTTPDTETTVVAGSGDGAVQVADARFVAYRVVRGDTLSLIGRQFGVDWRELAQINQLPDPDVIGVGQIIQVPVVDELSVIPGLIAADPDKAPLVAVFDAAAAEYGVPAELLKAVAWARTGWDNSIAADGESGIGLMNGGAYQLAEAAAGATFDPTDPAQAIAAMAAYLGQLLQQTQGDTAAALATYDEGLASQRDINWTQDTIDFIAAVFELRPVFDIRG